jgi:DNA-binding transcriptional LysR family regulator
MTRILIVNLSTCLSHSGILEEPEPLRSVLGPEFTYATAFVRKIDEILKWLLRFEYTMRGSEYADLKAFVAIAQFGSFSAAAKHLSVSPSALSQTLRQLEERLGVRLLSRTTRSVSLTERGAALLDRIVPLFEGFDQAVADLTASEREPTGLLRLNLPHIAATHLIAPVLGEFHRLYPSITLDITIDDTLSDIVAGRFDAGTRLGERLEKDMVAVRLGGPREAMVVASPRLLQRLRQPDDPHGLHRYPCIRFRWPGDKNLYRWEFEKAGRKLEIAVDGPLIANDTRMMLAAAIEGMGLAYVLDIEAWRHIEDGTLVRVLEDWTPPFNGFYLYHPSARQIPPQLKVFIDFLKAWVK